MSSLYAIIVVHQATTGIFLEKKGSDKMIHESIKDTYILCDYLLDLSYYYLSKIMKCDKGILAIDNNKRLKETTKAKRIENLRTDQIYWKDKKNKVDTLISKIRNHEITKIELEFM